MTKAELIKALQESKHDDNADVVMNIGGRWIEIKELEQWLDDDQPDGVMAEAPMLLNPGRVLMS